MIAFDPKGLVQIEATRAVAVLHAEVLRILLDFTLARRGRRDFEQHAVSGATSATVVMRQVSSSENGDGRSTPCIEPRVRPKDEKTRATFCERFQSLSGAEFDDDVLVSGPRWWRHEVGDDRQHELALTSATEVETLKQRLGELDANDAVKCKRCTSEPQPAFAGRERSDDPRWVRGGGSRVSLVPRAVLRRRPRRRSVGAPGLLELAFASCYEETSRSVGVLQTGGSRFSTC
jgi:hypothetical protein